MEAEYLLGHPVRHWTVDLSGRSLDLVGPANEDDLLESPDVQARFEADEYLPYWGQLWPSAVMLAAFVLQDQLGSGRSALEIGCGLGLVALGARLAGWNVLATDYDETALAFTRENARRNDLGPVQTRLLDWRHPMVTQRFDRILASDVLYERRNHEPVISLINHLLAGGGIALISDPNRKMAAGFVEMLRRAGLSCQTTSTHAYQPYGRYVKGTIYRVWREPVRANDA
ncbi:MAG: methyltransferase domain-containing protein [Phycisphaerae bacterium]|nr:methyltransferase domain-containing protein [Phycisphaerae bacterium]